MMKKLSKIALLAAASAFMLAVFPACGDDDEDNDPPPSVTKASVKIFNQKEEDITGKTDVAMKTEDVLNVQAIPSDFPDGEVTYGWGSGTATIAKVEQNSTNKAQAQITAVAAGTAKITVTVTVGDTTATADITVTVTAKEGEGQTSQPSVKIFNQKGEDITGKTDVAMETEDVLNVQAIPSDFPDGDVDYEWVSDPATVARVDQNPGNKAQTQVTALAAGTAKITVTAKSGDTEKMATFTVTVAAEGGSSEITFPLSITPTTTGSTPAYPTDADLSNNSPFVFTSPVSYTVCTKKKFDTGKYNTGSEVKTESRWNLGGALKSSSGSYNCYMKFDSAPSTKMTVKFFNTNADRTITVVSGEVETVGTVKTTKSDGTNGDLMSETFTVTKGSEVYLGATANGIWVAEIIWEE